MAIAENKVHFIKQNIDKFSITKLTQLLGISRSCYCGHRAEKHLKTSKLEQKVQKLTKENYFLYGYRKMYALVSKEFSVGINKVARIMRERGWSCTAKQKKFEKPGCSYKTFENVINKNWITGKPLHKLTTFTFW